MQTDLDLFFSDPRIVASLNEAYASSLREPIALNSRLQTSHRGDFPGNYKPRGFPVARDDGNSRHRPSFLFSKKYNLLTVVSVALVLYFLVPMLERFPLLASSVPSAQTVTEYLVTTVERTSTVTEQPVFVSTRTSIVWNNMLETTTVTSTSTEVETQTSTELETLTSALTEFQVKTETLSETHTETVTKTEVRTELIDAYHPDPPRKTALSAHVLYEYTTDPVDADCVLQPSENPSRCWHVGPDAAIGIELDAPSTVSSVTVNCEAPYPENNILIVYDVGTGSFGKLGSTVGNTLDLTPRALSRLVVRLKGNTGGLCVRSIDILD